MSKKINVIPIEKINPRVKEKRKKDAKKKLIQLLSLFFVFAMIIVYFQSTYSKVDHLTVKGNVLTTTDEIIKWSGFEKNDYFLKIRTSKMAEQLKEHGEIKKVQFKRGFPNKLTVTIEEYEQFAYVIKEEKIYPVLENAYIVNKESTTLNSSPILQDFEQNEYFEEAVSELIKLPSEILLCISEVQYTPSDIDKNKLTLYMNDGMQVLATITKLSNLNYYPDMISNIPDGKKGILDIQVGTFYKPFEEISDENKEEDEKQEEGTATQNSNQSGTQNQESSSANSQTNANN